MIYFYYLKPKSTIYFPILNSSQKASKCTVKREPKNGGGLLLYVNENQPSYKFKENSEIILFEFKWLLLDNYKPI